MAGLTEEDLLSLETPSTADIDAFVLAAQANERALAPKESPEEVRARAIRRDIYNRHGIPPEASDAEAIGIIADQAMDAGLVDESGRSTGAWANPQEREAARVAYANRGADPRLRAGLPPQATKEYDESKYLMDPQTASYMQNYQRDMDFLATSARQPDVDVMAYTGAPDPVAFRQTQAQAALEGWDRSSSNPLSRNTWNTANYGNPSQFMAIATYPDMPDAQALAAYGQGSQFMDALGEAIVNPDLPVANAMYSLNIPYETMALKFGGEADSWSEAAQGALGNATMATRYRPGAPSPILDLPADATPQERSNRVRELRTLNEQALIPQAAERWQRTWGWTPPAWMSDAGDLVMQMIDPTLLIPLGGIAANMAKTGVKAAAKPAAVGLAKDAVQEQVTGAGLLAGLGGSDPSREWFGEGGYFDLTPPAATIKNDEQLAAAKAARQQQYEVRKKDSAESVSSPRSVAYNR